MRAPVPAPHTDFARDGGAAPGGEGGSAAAGAVAGFGGELEALVARICDPERMRRERVKLAESILDRLGDPGTYASIAERAAAAVIDGGVPVHEVDRIIHAARRKIDADGGGSTGAYFVTAMTRLCREREDPWEF